MVLQGIICYVFPMLKRGRMSCEYHLVTWGHVTPPPLPPRSLNPLTLYVNNEQVVQEEQMFVTKDYEGADAKYLSCAFERIYVLDVVNMLEDLL